MISRAPDDYCGSLQQFRYSAERAIPAGSSAEQVATLLHLTPVIEVLDINLRRCMSSTPPVLDRVETGPATEKA